MTLNEKIKNLVAETFNIERSKLSEEVHFFNELGADSLLMLSFITALEREFNVNVTDEDFNQFYCVKNITHFVREKASISA